VIDENNAPAGDARQANLSAVELQLSLEFDRPDAANRQAHGDGAGAAGADRDINDIRFGSWSMPGNLMQMLQLQGQPSGELFHSFINTALHMAVDEDTIIKACLDHEPPYGGSIARYVRENGGEDYVKRVIASAANAPLVRTEKKLIRITGGHADDYWRTVETALRERKCPVFVRNKRLVQPLWRWHKDDGRNVLSIELEPYNLEQLTDMVQHHAVQFQKFDRRMRSWCDIDPPEKIMKRGLDIHHYELPEIIGVITSPTMRPDLSLLTEPGYDAATQVWLKPSDDVQLPPIPERPTRDDAKKALALLNDLLDGFPFDGETKEKRTSVARSAALAAIITATARGALTKAVPLFIVTAPKARTGKTYLINLIALLATGHVPVSIAGAEKKEEFEKRVETAALAGRPILHLNNLPNGMVVESDRLSELATEGIVKIRKLGRHEEGQCDCRATTAFLNGNNILVSSDLVARTIHCRINAQKENPGERTFALPLPDQRVRANRGIYLGAVFTIIRAFFAAGAPQQDKRQHMAGFEQWEQWVQQPLIWLGMDDPWGAMEEIQSMDPEEEMWQNAMKKSMR